MAQPLEVILDTLKASTQLASSTIRSGRGAGRSLLKAARGRWGPREAATCALATRIRLATRRPCPVAVEGSRVNTVRRRDGWRWVILSVNSGQYLVSLTARTTKSDCRWSQRRSSCHLERWRHTFKFILELKLTDASALLTVDNYSTVYDLFGAPAEIHQSSIQSHYNPNSAANSKREKSLLNIFMLLNSFTPNSTDINV